MGEKEPFEDQSISHAKCEECLKKQAKNQEFSFLTKFHRGWYTSSIIPVRPRVLLAPASCGAGFFI